MFGKPVAGCRGFSPPKKTICQPSTATGLANWFGEKLPCGLPAAPRTFVDHHRFGAASWTFDHRDLTLLVMRPCRTIVVYHNHGGMAMRTIHPMGDDDTVGRNRTVMRAEGCTHYMVSAPRRRTPWPVPAWIMPPFTRRNIRTIGGGINEAYRRPSPDIDDYGRGIGDFGHGGSAAIAAFDVIAGGFDDDLFTVDFFVAQNLQNGGRFTVFLQFDDCDVLGFRFIDWDLQNDRMGIPLEMVLYADVVRFAILIEVEVVDAVGFGVEALLEVFEGSGILELLKGTFKAEIVAGHTGTVLIANGICPLGKCDARPKAEAGEEGE